jgi:hypothetical protein
MAKVIHRPPGASAEGAAAVRARVCPLCNTPPVVPCQLKPEGDHLARYLDAYTTGQLTKAYMAKALGELVVIDACAVITGEAPDAAPLTRAEDLALQLASVSDALDGYRAVLEVVREALDIPHAATFSGDEKRKEILCMRVMHALLMVRAVLDGRGPAEWNIAYCREQLAKYPATGYRVFGTPTPSAGDGTAAPERAPRGELDGDR